MTEADKAALADDKVYELLGRLLGRANHLANFKSENKDKYLQENALWAEQIHAALKATAPKEAQT